MDVAGTGSVKVYSDFDNATTTNLVLPAQSTNFKMPVQLELDEGRQVMYFIIDARTYILQLNLTSNTIKRFAGSISPNATFIEGGLAATVKFGLISSISLDSTKNILYVADLTSNFIRKIDLYTERVTTLVGNGKSTIYTNTRDVPATNTTVIPRCITVDPQANRVYYCEESCVRMLNITSNMVSTIVGNPVRSAYSGDGGKPSTATLMAPSGISVAENGNIYISDPEAKVVRFVDFKLNQISTRIGSGTRVVPSEELASTSQLNTPTSFDVDLKNQLIYMVEDSSYIRVINRISGIISLLVKLTSQISAIRFFPSTNSLYAYQLGSNELFVIDASTGLEKNTIYFENIYFIEVIPDVANNVLFLLSSYDDTVHEYNIISETTRVFAGNGIRGYSPDFTLAVNASLNYPQTLLVANDLVYIGDLNHVIRVVNRTSGIIKTIAGKPTVATIAGKDSGNGGFALNATLNTPIGMSMDYNNQLLYVLEIGGVRVNTDSILPLLVQQVVKLVKWELFQIHWVHQCVHHVQEVHLMTRKVHKILPCVSLVPLPRILLLKEQLLLQFVVFVILDIIQTRINHRVLLGIRIH